MEKVFCRSFSRSNAIFLDAGGPGGLYGLGYSRRLLHTGNHSVTIWSSVAVSSFSEKFDDELFRYYFIVPEASAVLFRHRHHIEAGVSLKLSLEDRAEHPVQMAMNYFPLFYRIGYRLESPVRRYYFRAGISSTYLEIYEGERGYFPAWPYIGFGYKF